MDGHDLSRVGTPGKISVSKVAKVRAKRVTRPVKKSVTHKVNPGALRHKYRGKCGVYML